MRDQLLKLCVEGMSKKGLDSSEYKERLREELKELDAQAEHEYFVDLHSKKAKFENNENNLLIAYLLDLVDDFDINLPPVSVQGEFPDIDIDYLPQVRDYLKVEWAPKEFGKENVCAIGNYTTYGIKSSLIDMAKVHDKDRNEIIGLTTQLGLKDNDGKTLTFDKALEQFEKLGKYCEDNPDVADAARRLLNRNRGMGMHAGGLIISDQRINKLVPLVKGKDDAYVSAFVEGLSGTDLGPLGLIKFDLLVVTDLKRIVTISELVKRNHPHIKTISALDGTDDDWSDTAYLNDPKAIALADEGKLKCIFQFDSNGMREMVKKGGVTGFDDLPAYSALYRPGPLNMDMDKTYIRRKRGQEPVSNPVPDMDGDLHPILRPILGRTYGVMVYQEQVMKILNVVGDIPLIHCEKVRKAMSKKKVKEFARYKEQFVGRGQSNLGWEKKEVEELWDQVEAFSEYGFNASHAYAYSYISSRLLYLKAHFPIEFYCGTLQCETQSGKIKDYKLEAEKDGVELKRVDINKSGWNWEIVDDLVYMGFSDIKGIGEDVSHKIEEGQPYSGFDDFLQRFGTDSKVLKPLIALNCFGEEEDRKVLHEFWEYFKHETKKRQDRDKRADKSKLKIVEEMDYVLYKNGGDGSSENFLKEILKSGLLDLPKKDFFISEFEFENFNFQHLKDDLEDILKIGKKYKRNVESLKKKKDSDLPITLADFMPSGEIDTGSENVYNELLGIAESMYYGFAWQHPIEFSPDYKGGMTFDRFDEESTLLWAPIECQIVSLDKKGLPKKESSLQERLSKKGNPYYVFTVQDENFNTRLVTMWEDDFVRFKEEIEHWDGEFRQGNFLRMRINRPDPGFSSHVFQSPTKRNRSELPEKAADGRLVVMAKPEQVEIKHEPSKAEEKLLKDINDEGFTIVGI